MKLKISYISPLMLTGILLVLLPLFVVMTLDRIREHEQYVTAKMVERGQSLIRSFEAGTRAGMMNVQWGAAKFQRLLTEVSYQPDILFLMITSPDGTIWFHSDPEKVGSHYKTMPTGLKDADDHQIFHQVVQLPKDSSAFVVYKKFTPERTGRDLRRHRECPDFRTMMKKEPYRDYYIFAGLSYEKAQNIHKRFVNQMVTRGVIFLLLGLAGILSLFAFQGYRSARSRLETVQAFSNTVVDNMPAGLITVDTDLNILSVNRAAADILGGRPRVLPPEMADLVDQLEKENRVVEKQMLCDRPNDRPALLDISMSSMVAETGDLSGYMFLFKDLTELDRLKKEVETSKRLAAIGKLAAGVAHEIRNPLSSIKGFATYFKERYANVPRDQETAEIMIQEVQRLNRSVTQLLEFARPVDINIVPTDLKDLVYHALRLVQHEIDQSDIQVSILPDDASKEVYTDPDQVSQVLLNLFLNSLQAMDQGGKLTVKIDIDPRESFFSITVDDTGKGIAPEDMEKIFDPYFTTRSTGTGLGLAVVHRIIESLKGKIEMDSTPGKGTRVTIILPQKESK